ncbi:MAG: SRPBCC family protein [Taibaiella sp.]|nr:SRPBCC family protein [Taibaiella sp.]
MANPITIQTTVKATIDRVWQLWTEPEHVTQWNNASEDWYTPFAENDVRPGGKFTFRMAARDGSFSFDFGGEYDQVEEHRFMSYTLGDGRRVSVTFTANGDSTDISETFDPENENPEEMQRAGWQAILDNFKKYAETR